MLFNKCNDWYEIEVVSIMYSNYCLKYPVIRLHTTSQSLHFLKTTLVSGITVPSFSWHLEYRIYTYVYLTVLYLNNAFV